MEKSNFGRPNRRDCDIKIHFKLLDYEGLEWI